MRCSEEEHRGSVLVFPFSLSDEFLVMELYNYDSQNSKTESLERRYGAFSSW